jgi:hypothetical protein
MKTVKYFVCNQIAGRNCLPTSTSPIITSNERKNKANKSIDVIRQFHYPKLPHFRIEIYLKAFEVKAAELVLHIRSDSEIAKWPNAQSSSAGNLHVDPQSATMEGKILHFIS